MERWEAENHPEARGPAILEYTAWQSQERPSLKLGVKQELSPEVCSLTSTRASASHEHMLHTHTVSEVNTAVTPSESMHGSALWAAWRRLLSPCLYARTLSWSWQPGISFYPDICHLIRGPLLFSPLTDMSAGPATALSARLTANTEKFLVSGGLPH